MRNKAFRMTMLFDFYGDLLTPRQKEFFDLYYNEDLSLAEIAENAGITRQGVRDVLVRSEAILTEMEEKTGIVARFLEIQKISDRIETAARKIKLINEERYLSTDLLNLANEIQDCAELLKE
ncbi:MAG: DNA-binding protein [Oscillospiraceae bacterium]|nr:DNA-binding protein [Oscillospiraceae bacterium]